MPSHIHPFLLSGGSGTRLWPLSRRAHPKQFLSLAGAPSLLQQTCLRLEDPLFAAPTVLGHHDHRFIIAEQLQQIGITPAAIILEPEGRNTAPAALIAALKIAEQDPGDLIMLLPSDHAIGDASALTASIRAGLRAAREGRIVIFGAAPDRPETGYGYIETADGSAEARDVLRFVEKPDLASAETYLGNPRFLWNSGLVLASADTLIEAFRRHAAELIAPCRAALEGARPDLDYLRLEPAAYRSCPSISLDYAVLEKAGNIACVPLQGSWSDLGAWGAVWRQMDRDEDGNAAHGEVILHETGNCLAYSADGAALALIGLDDVIAVATRDAVLVAARDRADSIGPIAARLQAEKPDGDAHARIHRPWGWYEPLQQGPGFLVKSLTVKPRAQLSLQSHRHRAEHWVVVSGRVDVTLEEKTFTIGENQSTYIPIGARHRLSNPYESPARLIEVQSGAHLSEDDIVRFEDDYGRKAGDGD